MTSIYERGLDILKKYTAYQKRTFYVKALEEESYSNTDRQTHRHTCMRLKTLPRQIRRQQVYVSLLTLNT